MFNKNYIREIDMKKIILTAIATSALASSAMASYMDGMYIKADVGATMFQQEKDKVSTLKMKSDTTAALSVAFGTTVMDNLRVDLAFGHHFDPVMKKTGGSTKYVHATNKTADAAFTRSTTVNHKIKVSSLMLRGHFDAFDFDFAKLFVSGGVGMARVSEKITHTAPAVALADAPTGGVAETAITDYKTTIKAKDNVAFTIGTGLAFEVADGVNLDVAYSYNSYGSTKAANENVAAADKDKNLVGSGKLRLNAHMLSAGVRFSL